MKTRRGFILALGILTVLVAVVVILLLGDDGDDAEKEGETAGTTQEFIIGIIMVGRHDDNGWSEAHYEGGIYVQDFVPGTRMIYVENVNPANPDVTVASAVADLVRRGARIIIANSDDMKAAITAVAAEYPATTFLHISGDGVLTGEAPPNMGNLMGRMEYGKMIAGCAAALKTQSGKIGYVGAIENNETRRLAVSAYLGARHCYEQRGLDPGELEFEVVWIGFWFYIDGVTLDPTAVANTMLDDGADVLISGLDTTEALAVAQTRSTETNPIWAVPYDFIDACDLAPDVCLGVPYFNWGPAYVQTVEAVRGGYWEPAWLWLDPHWLDINDLNVSAIGFKYGQGLTSDDINQLQAFIQALARGAMGHSEGLILFRGALIYADGTVFLAEGEVATDAQIWYMPKLLMGMQDATPE